MLIQGGNDPRSMMGGLSSIGGLGGDTQYAGPPEQEPAGPTPSGPSNVTGRALQAIQQQNALMQQEHAQEQSRVNWIVGGVVTVALVGGIWAFWKSRQA
jgi:cobalamin biosynthesis Mg chelatase CobN